MAQTGFSSRSAPKSCRRNRCSRWPERFADGISEGLGSGRDHARRGRMVCDAAPARSARARRRPNSSRIRRSSGRARGREAFDADGQPTKAALGFAASCGVGVDELAAGGWTEGSRCCMFVGTKTGEATTALLPGIVQSGARCAADREAHALGRRRGGVRAAGALGRDAVRHDCRRLPRFSACARGKHSRGHRFHAPAAAADRAVRRSICQRCEKAHVMADVARSPRAHSQRSGARSQSRPAVRCDRRRIAG